MLALGLEKISQANNPDTDIRIFADTDTNISELGYVRDKYAPEALIFRARPHPPALSGTWNILHALKHAAQFAVDKVFLIEEDVLVAANFFDWHRQNLRYDMFATCGREHKSKKYTNPGSAFHTHSLQMLAEHINNDFFSNPTGYMDKHFPGTVDDSPHDDGLIRRMIAHYSLKVGWPETPIAAHIGFRAYRRYDRWINDGGIEQRIETVRKFIAEPKTVWNLDLEFLPEQSR